MLGGVAGLAVRSRYRTTRLAPRLTRAAFGPYSVPLTARQLRSLEALPPGSLERAFAGEFLAALDHGFLWGEPTSSFAAARYCDCGCALDSAGRCCGVPPCAGRRPGKDAGA